MVKNVGTMTAQPAFSRRLHEDAILHHLFCIFFVLPGIPETMYACRDRTRRKLSVGLK